MYECKIHNCSRFENSNGTHTLCKSKVSVLSFVNKCLSAQSSIQTGAENLIDTTNKEEQKMKILCPVEESLGIVCNSLLQLGRHFVLLQLKPGASIQ